MKKSLPSRERGLKCSYRYQLWKLRRSLPSRERGLKSKVGREADIIRAVAPFAGAWIEIQKRQMDIIG